MKFRFAVSLFVVAVIAFSSLAYLFKIILPSGLPSVAVYLKDVFLIGLMGIAACAFLIRPTFLVSLPRLDKLIIAFLCICLIYTVISPMGKAECFKTFWAICFGPMLYLALNCIKVDYSISIKIFKAIYIWMLFLAISGIFIYALDQESFNRAIGLYDYMAERFGVNQLASFYRYYEGMETPRMAGLLLAPLDMGFLLIFLFSFGLFFAKNILHKCAFFIIWLIAAYLCDVRSVWVGLAGGMAVLWLIGRKGIIRVFNFILIASGAIAIGYMFFYTSIGTSRLDVSAFTHLDDLFIRGPQLVLKYWMGIGIGMTSARLSHGQVPVNFIGNIESFYYSLSIQIGIIGLLLYMFIIGTIITRIIADRKAMRITMNTGILDRFYNGALISVVAIHIGFIFLPIMDSKIISSLMWTTIFIVLNIRRALAFSIAKSKIPALLQPAASN